MAKIQMQAVQNLMNALNFPCERCKIPLNSADSPLVHRGPQRAPRQGRMEAAPGGAGGLLLDGVPGVLPGPLRVPPRVLALFAALRRRLGDGEQGTGFKIMKFIPKIETI